MNQDELEAKLHREREAKRLLQLFQAENGREPRDEEDLNSWAASPKARGLIHGQLDKKGKVDPSYPNATLVGEIRWLRRRPKSASERKDN